MLLRLTRVRLTRAAAGLIAAAGFTTVVGAAMRAQAPAAGPPPAGGQGRAMGVTPPVQPAPPTPKPLFAQTKPVRECATLKDVSLPDTTIESAAVDPGNETIPASCRITAITTHPPAGD